MKASLILGFRVQRLSYKEYTNQTTDKFNFDLNNPDMVLRINMEHLYLMDTWTLPTLLLEPQLPDSARAEISEIDTWTHKTKTNTKHYYHSGELTKFRTHSRGGVIFSVLNSQVLVVCWFMLFLFQYYKNSTLLLMSFLNYISSTNRRIITSPFTHFVHNPQHIAVQISLTNKLLL